MKGKDLVVGQEYYLCTSDNWGQSGATYGNVFNGILADSGRWRETSWVFAQHGTRKEKLSGGETAELSNSTLRDEKGTQYLFKVHRRAFMGGTERDEYVLYSGGSVRGPWAEVKAKVDEASAVRKADNESRDAVRKECERKCDNAVAGLLGWGIVAKAEYVTERATPDHCMHVVMTPEEAEKAMKQMEREE